MEALLFSLSAEFEQNPANLARPNYDTVWTARFTRLTSSLPSNPGCVTTAQLTTLKTTFDNAIIKANKGGTLATAQKNAARAAVVDALNKNGSYVDINCN